MTGVNRWCGYFQECLKIRRMKLCWNCMVQTHCILLRRVRCMLSGQKTKKLNRMRRTWWYRLQSGGQWGGVGVSTSQWKTICSHTERKCTPYWARVDWGRASTTEDSGGEIHLTGCFRSMEGSLIVASMFLICVGNHQGSLRHSWTMVQWMATQYFGRFCNIPIAQRDISANACQWTCVVCWTWQWRWIKRGSPSPTRLKCKCTPQCTSSPNGGANSSASCPIPSFEAVANQVFCGWCGYIPHVCRNGLWWMHPNAAQIAAFMQSLCNCNDTNSGWDRSKSYSCIPCSNNSEVLGIEWALTGICTSCPARATQITPHMVTEYGSRWLW